MLTADDLLALLRVLKHLALEDLEYGHGASAIEAVDELRRRRQASIHLTSRGRRVVSLTDLGRGS